MDSAIYIEPIYYKIDITKPFSVLILRFVFFINQAIKYWPLNYKFRGLKFDLINE